MRGELGRQFLVDLLHRRIRVRRIQISENALGAIEQFAAFLHRHDRVFESRFRGVACDLFDFLQLRRHPGLDCRLVVLVLDLIEERVVVLERALLEQRIRAVRVFFGWRRTGGVRERNHGEEGHRRPQAQAHREGTNVEIFHRSRLSGFGEKSHRPTGGAPCPQVGRPRAHSLRAGDRARIGAPVVVHRDDRVTPGARLPTERRGAIRRPEKGAVGEPINRRHIRVSFGGEGKRARRRLSPRSNRRRPSSAK